MKKKSMQKGHKRALSLLLALLMAFSLLNTAITPAQAAVSDTFDDGTLTYEVLSESGTSGTVKVIADSYTGASYTIPAQVSHGGISYDVVEIGTYAFGLCSNLTSIVIPDSVETIGDQAFGNCTALLEIAWGTGLKTIGGSAFSKAALTSLTIPNTVEHIGQQAFASYPYLQELVIPDSVTTIEKEAFYRSPLLEIVTIGSGVTEIPKQMLYTCPKLATLVFTGNTPPSPIASNAFTDASGNSALTEIYVPVGAKAAYETALPAYAALIIEGTPASGGPSTAVAPDQPENLTAAPGDKKITLNWEAPSSDGGAQILYYQASKDNGTTFVNAGTVPATNAPKTTYTFTGLTNGTSYDFAVRAVNNKGEGPWEYITATPLEPSTSITVPDNATVTLHTRANLYGSHVVIPETGIIDNGDSTKTWNYDLESSAYYYVRQSGHVTQAGSIRRSDTLTITPIPLPTTRLDYTTYSNSMFHSYDDAVLTSAPHSGHLELDQVGDTFWLRPLRAGQLVSNDTSNLYYEPDFHCDVISGSSVTVDNTGLVTATGTGTSLVRITYDPIHCHGETFNGIDPIDVGLVVVTVGAASSMDTGIDLLEFDTVYIDGGVIGPDGTALTAPQTTANYCFTPPAGAEVAVLSAPSNPLEDASGIDFWGFATESNWNPVTITGGKADVTLTEGRNIIRVTLGSEVSYHVTKARTTKTIISNLTHPGQAAAVGDTIELHLDNIYLPIPKLTKIHNPGYNLGGITTDGVQNNRLQYDINGYTVVGDTGTQHMIRTQNSFRLYLDQPGTVSFSNGKIFEGIVGFSGRDAHKKIPDEGIIPGITGMAHEYGPFHLSALPGFSLEVPDNESTAPSKLEYSVLQSLYPSYMMGSAPATSSQRTVLQNWHNYFIGSLSPIGIKNIVPNAGHSYTDYDFYFLNWSEGATGTRPANPTGTVVQNADANTILSGSISLSSGEYGGANLVVMPKDTTAGYPTTYSIRNGSNTHHEPRLAELDVAVLGANQKDFSPTDGLLKAKPLDCVIDGTPTTLNLGYGFLYNEKEYTVTVPSTATSIKLRPETPHYKLEGAGNGIKKDVYCYAEVSANGSTEILGNVSFVQADIEKQLPQSGAISLTGRETVVTVTMKQQASLPSTVNAYPDVTYTIRILKKRNTSQGQLHCASADKPTDKGCISYHSAAHHRRRL